MSHIINARAWARVDLAGGWSDTSLREEEGGAVVNYTLKAAPTTVRLRIEHGGGKKVPKEGGNPGETEHHRFFITSYDTEETISTSAERIRKGEYNGTLDLFMAALKQSGLADGARPRRRGSSLSMKPLPIGAEIEVKSKAPPGSGLGSSSALGVATMGALSRYIRGRRILPKELAQWEHRLETEELGLNCGVQDQAASAFGGLNMILVRYPDFEVIPIPVEQEVLWDYNDRAFVVYTGKSHFSSAMHDKVIEQYKAGKNCRHFDTITACAFRMRDAWLDGDIDEIGRIMNDNWAAQKALARGITTRRIEELHRLALDCGAVGFKANGAGGGGTVTILAGHSLKSIHKLDTALRRLRGIQIIPGEIGFDGVTVWPGREQYAHN